MKKPSKVNIIDGIGFDLQESFKDLFNILNKQHNDIEEIKKNLKDKKIMD